MYNFVEKKHGLLVACLTILGSVFAQSLDRKEVEEFFVKSLVRNGCSESAVLQNNFYSKFQKMLTDQEIGEALEIINDYSAAVTNHAVNRAGLKQSYFSGQNDKFFQNQLTGVFKKLLQLEVKEEVKEGVKESPQIKRKSVLVTPKKHGSSYFVREAEELLWDYQETIEAMLFKMEKAFLLKK